MMRDQVIHVDQQEVGVKKEREKEGTEKVCRLVTDFQLKYTAIARNIVLEGWNHSTDIYYECCLPTSVGRCYDFIAKLRY